MRLSPPLGGALRRPLCHAAALRQRSVKLSGRLESTPTSRKKTGRDERIDEGMLINALNLNDLVGTMGDFEEAGSIGKRGNALHGVPPCLQKSWAHFKRWPFAQDGFGGFRQGKRDRM